MKNLVAVLIVAFLTHSLFAGQDYQLDFGDTEGAVQAGFTSIQFDSSVAIDGAEFTLTGTGTNSIQTNGDYDSLIDGNSNYDLLYDCARSSGSGCQVALTFTGVKSSIYTVRFHQWLGDMYGVPENSVLQEQGGDVLIDFGKQSKNVDPYEYVVMLDAGTTYEFVITEQSSRNYAYIAGFELIETVLQAHYPNPANKELFVSTTPMLSWTKGLDENDLPNADVVKYYLYGTFTNGVDDPNLYYISEIDASADTASYGPVSLAYNTQYSWKVEQGVDDGQGGVYPPGDVNNIDGFVWSFTTTPATPAITEEPVGQLVGPGADAVFTLAGENIDSVTWYKYVDGVNDTEVGIGLSFTIPEASQADEGKYYAVASNGAGNDTSEVARLMIKRLVAHWDFDGDLVDNVDNFTGTLIDPNVLNTGTPVEDYVPGIFDHGQALSLSNDFYVEVEDSVEAFNFYPLGFTVSAWVNTTNNDYCGILGKNDRTGDVQQGFALYQQYSTGGIVMREAGGIYSPSGTSIRDGLWHMITATFDPDAGLLTVYVDGLVTGQKEVSGNPLENSSPLLLGIQDVIPATEPDTNPSLYWPFNAIIDDVKIWSYPLDKVAVAYEYNDFANTTLCLDRETLEFDVTGPDGNPDCIVDLFDFTQIMVSNWLNCREVPNCLPDPRN